jgi:hypothetical protein
LRVAACEAADVGTATAAAADCAAAAAASAWLEEQQLQTVTTGSS